jgi:hypothetical protein
MWSEIEPGLILLLGIALAYRVRRPFVRAFDALTSLVSRVTGFDRRYLRGWMLTAFLWAPSPVFMCFDGCLSPQVVLPLALSWVPILTLFSWIFPLTWLWHGVFMLPFLGVFLPLDSWLKPTLSGKWRLLGKRLLFLLIFVVYWGVVSRLWGLIPLETRQALLARIFQMATSRSDVGGRIS